MKNTRNLFLFIDNATRNTGCLLKNIINQSSLLTGSAQFIYILVYLYFTGYGCRRYYRHNEWITLSLFYADVTLLQHMSFAHHMQSNTS
mmetsp:Transcript_1726/g.2488  ORF Transcript_1726/g.2488 Transcript_1726/m.2488 type:complete len:89 (+) Transcript_1726:740-1006(+)